VLGALAMIDQGETDWKVIAIDTADPKAATINCAFFKRRGHACSDGYAMRVAAVDDIPEIVDAIRTWFRDYKIPDGKPANVFALGGKPITPVRRRAPRPSRHTFLTNHTQTQAEAVIHECHDHWKRLCGAPAAQ
jgi:inorganic pyrophosphatase